MSLLLAVCMLLCVYPNVEVKALENSSSTYDFTVDSLGPVTSKDVPANTTFEFKFIKKDATGNVTWESGNNRIITSASGSAATMDTPVYTFGN